MRISPAASRASLILALLVGFLALAAPAADHASSLRVILVTLDGARVEEIFGGMDEAVASAFARSRGTSLDEWPLLRSLRGATAEERRMRLMPFLWGTLVRRHGSIAGNPARGSRVSVSNQFGYSLPGYAEMLTGRSHDAIITDNDAQESPADTILERARRELGLGREQVAVFASWGRLRGMAERHTGTLHVDAGPGEETGPFPELRSDAETSARALAHLASHKPRVLYLALGETDDWAHEGRYDRVLEAYRIADEALRRIWLRVESDPEYTGRTCLLVTTDHGRGKGLEGWKHHGAGIEGTDETFMLFVSPQSQARGEWTGGASLQLAQTAPTLAMWLGLAPDPSSARVVEGVGRGRGTLLAASR
jgi:hypothetical protein